MLHTFDNERLIFFFIIYQILLSEFDSLKKSLFVLKIIEHKILV